MAVKKQSKGKTAARKAGRAVKKAASSLLGAGAEILGAGSEALANPRRRIKIRNRYVDLVIKGQAKKTPKGWKVGRKTFEQGRGTVAVSSGYYLDRSTGLVYSKRARNAAKKTTVKKRAKRNVAKRVHSTRKTSTKKRVSSSRKAGSRRPMAKARKSAARNPSAESIRKKFAGQINGERDLFFPQGTPSGKLAKLGKLVLIETEKGTIKPVAGTAWLCADERERLHIGSTTSNPLFNGPARSFGKVKKVEYESSKPHLGYARPIIWFHHMGERGGVKPTLHADGKGGLVFKGGRYELTERGIEH